MQIIIALILHLSQVVGLLYSAQITKTAWRYAKLFL
jgi:hypothetical protein